MRTLRVDEAMTGTGTGEQVNCHAHGLGRGRCFDVFLFPLDLIARIT